MLRFLCKDQNDTQAAAAALAKLLRPGDVMVSGAGKPYDTMEEVIGIAGEPGCGSLKDFGVSYRQVELKEGKIDIPALLDALTPETVCISVGSNSYGHPAEEMLRRLGERECAVYRTDLHGNIRISWNEGDQHGKESNQK